MEGNNLIEIMNSLINAPFIPEKSDLKSFAEMIKQAIYESKDLILEANKIDVKNNQGIVFDFEIAQNIYNNVIEEECLFGKVVSNIRNEKDNLSYGKQIYNIGKIVNIFDGNTYTLIEMVFKNVLANNKVVFASNSYMYATNKIVIQTISNCFKKAGLNSKMFQLYIADNFKSLLSNFANIDLVIAIGDRQLQNEVLKEAKNKVIISGYEHFDLYIDSIKDIDFIKNIINSNSNVSTYILDKLNTDIEGIYVSDIDEAIAQINYCGSRYAASIFTDDVMNASKFIDGIKTTYVTVNTSPTIERKIDINNEQLTTIKTIIYPIKKLV